MSVMPDPICPDCGHELHWNRHCGVPLHSSPYCIHVCTCNILKRQEGAYLDRLDPLAGTGESLSERVRRIDAVGVDPFGTAEGE